MTGGATAATGSAAGDLTSTNAVYFGTSGTYKITSDGLPTLAVEAWTAPTFENSWVNYGVTFNPAGYYKDGQGRVHLRGLVKSGTCGAAIFTLPMGYRPSYTELQVTITNAAIGRIDINTAGDVIGTTCNNAWISLDGISFRAN